MLLRFGVRNHLSLKDTQELSLVASTLNDVDSGLIPCAGSPSGSVLPVAVIYGANASGKSNVVSAIRYMRTSVLFSHNRGEPGAKIPRTPFVLEAEAPGQPSEFDIDFLVGDTRYHYGFEVSDTEFLSEWLYAFPSGRRQILFRRERQRFYFGRSLKGRNKVISDLTRPNSLFLSAAAQNDHEELSKIASFFRSFLGESNMAADIGMASAQLAKEEVDRRVIDFLGRMGTGVVDYRKLEVDFPSDLKPFVQELQMLVKRTVKGAEDIDLGSELQTLLQLGHRGTRGESVFLDLDRESSGTRRLLVLLGSVFRAMDNGELLVVDELDASLHTQACEAVVALFSLRATNPKGAQMIATTHDTNLLRSSLLRRDQIWFTEKSPDGATHLYPLTEIRTRKGDNVEKGYLQGRFGAIPFSGSVLDLLQETQIGPAQDSKLDSPQASA